MHEKGKDRATPATCQDDASLQEELKGSFSLENGWGLYYSCHEHCRVVPLYGMHMFSIFFCVVLCAYVLLRFIVQIVQEKNKFNFGLIDTCFHI